MMCVHSRVLCQFEVRPDVRFDEQNDRFDVSPLFDPGQYAEKEDFRRSGSKSKNAIYIVELNENETPQKHESSNNDKRLLQLINILRPIQSENRRDGFALHDNMRSAEEEQNFERNLEQFRAHDFRKNLFDYFHGGNNSDKPTTVGGYRRSGVHSDTEILMQHALPISMKVKGYLQAPSDL